MLFDNLWSSGQIDEVNRKGFQIRRKRYFAILIGPNPRIIFNYFHVATRAMLF